MNRLVRGLLPSGVVAASLLVAACAPPPAPAPAAPPQVAPAPSTCEPTTTGAAGTDGPGAATSSGSEPDADATEVVVVAVDGSGRPQIVTAEPDEAGTTSAALDAAPGVEVLAVEPDREMTLAGSTGGDPYRPQQWALDDLVAESLWALGTGTGVDIAVVDTGVLGSHPDLAGRLCSGVAFLGSTGVAQLGMGTVDDNGHGTHVAGIAAAGTGDGIGVAGVAPSARLIPVRVLDGSGSGSSSDVARGITWAVDHGAEVINLSLGGGHSFAVQAAVEYAEASGVLVVAAAGNAGPSGPPNYPAALDEALAVASYDEGGAVSSFSTRGSYVDLAAPGSGIVSTYRTGGWTYMSGTSMATPQVAGVAALLAAADPSMSPAQLRARLVDTATDAGPIGHDTAYGWGRVDALAARTG